MSGRRRSRPATQRQYPRTARLNTLLQEIAADYFERTDDEALGFLTITGVSVDNDLNRAEVFVSTLDGVDDELLEALEEHRRPLQAEISRQARIRKTPEVRFASDHGIEQGSRVEEVLASLGLGGDDQPDESDESVDDGGAEPGADDELDFGRP